MKPTETELVLQELRQLNKTMDPANPDPVKIREFRDLFKALDELLKNGATFPNSWITKANYTQLPTETTHTITDFDPPTDEQLRKRGLAWCGHPMASSTQYCRNRNCGNFINNIGPGNLTNI